jgi:hypothetical protein
VLDHPIRRNINGFVRNVKTTSATLNFFPVNSRSLVSPSISAFPILLRSMKVNSHIPNSQGGICKSNFLVTRLSMTGLISYWVSTVFSFSTRVSSMSTSNFRSGLFDVGGLCCKWVILNTGIVYAGTIEERREMGGSKENTSDFKHSTAGI